MLWLSAVPSLLLAFLSVVAVSRLLHTRFILSCLMAVDRIRVCSEGFEAEAGFYGMGLGKWHGKVAVLEG